MKKISEYFRSPYWKKAKNALINIVYGLVALVGMAAPIAAVTLITIVFPKAFLIVVIVAVIIFGSWLIGSLIRGEQ